MEQNSFTYLLREKYKNFRPLNFTLKYLKTNFLGLVHSAPWPLLYFWEF